MYAEVHRKDIGAISRDARNFIRLLTCFLDDIITYDIIVHMFT